MKKVVSKVKFFVFIIMAMLFIMPHVALAIPELQLYIQGATYDTSTETWVLTSSGPFTLWVLGDTEKKGTLFDVKLTAAVSTAEAIAGGSIALTPTTASGITDPSVPGIPTPIDLNGPNPGVISTDGAVPVMGDGSQLPTHGIYGFAGTSFYEWNLGDFTLTDSPIGDFINSYPTTFPDMGQINAYTVAATGFSAVHFDAFDHYVKNNQDNQYVFAPFSHDAEAHIVPEPGVMLLFGSGLVGLAGLRRKFRA